MRNGPGMARQVTKYSAEFTKAEQPVNDRDGDDQRTLLQGTVGELNS